MSTIKEVLDQWQATHDQYADAREELEAALMAREDQMRSELAMIADRLGTFPEFVAEAFAEVGLGTPPTPEVREMLRHQFAQRMEWLQEQYRQQGGGL